MNLEHVAFHYIGLGRIFAGEILLGRKIVALSHEHILPILNPEDIPNDESYQSIVCLQEVINEKNEHCLIYFDVYVGFIGGVEC